MAINQTNCLYSNYYDDLATLNKYFNNCFIYFCFPIDFGYSSVTVFRAIFTKPRASNHAFKKKKLAKTLYSNNIDW